MSGHTVAIKSILPPTNDSIIGQVRYDRREHRHRPVPGRAHARPGLVPAHGQQSRGEHRRHRRQTRAKDWYLGAQYRVEQFNTTDGNRTLIEANVQNLVDAMASFAPPAAGQTSLPPDYQSALAPVIAANWQ
jgi:hypothetical protein